MNLLIKCFKEATRGMCISNEENETLSKRDETKMSGSVHRAPGMKSMEIKSKTRGSGRCCMCFDPFPIQDVNVVVFFCSHGYHATCLMESIVSTTSKKEQKTSAKEAVIYYEDENGYVDEDEDEEAGPSGAPKLRCILCTTAAG